MVVRPDGTTLCLTTQPDHAQLTGELVAAWGGEPFEPVEPLASVRLAAEMHDAGWTELEAAPRIDPQTGRPYSFLEIPQNLHTEAHTRTVERARAVDPYAGLLTSLHSAGLYRERYGFMSHLQFRPVAPEHQGAVDRFLALQQQVQEELITTLKPDMELLWTHYRWFQFWDALSLYPLMFHADQLKEQLLGLMPLRPGGPEVEIWLFGAGENQFRVDPWPFKPQSITLTWRARLLPNRPYESDAAFQAHFRESPLLPQQLTLMPA